MTEKLIDQGCPGDDTRRYRECLGQFATGVTVVTTGTGTGAGVRVGGGFGAGAAGATRAGVTANSYTSVSLDPPLVLWAISTHSRSFNVFRQAAHFCINILSDAQIDVSQAFSGKAEDKFAGIAWSEGINGVPVLDGAIGALECSVDAIHPGGDHLIIVGRVERYTRRPGAPLLFLQGRYGVGEDHPGGRQPATQVDAARRSSIAGDDRALLHLLGEAHHRMSESFEAQRQAEEITLAQGRTLAVLDANPGLSIDALQRATWLGRRDVEDAIATLASRLLLVDEAGRLRLTEAGSQRRRAMSERWNRFQAQRLAGIPQADIQTLRDTLQRISAAFPA